MLARLLTELTTCGWVRGNSLCRISRARLASESASSNFFSEKSFDTDSLSAEASLSSGDSSWDDALIKSRRVTRRLRIFIFLVDGWAGSRCGSEEHDRDTKADPLRRVRRLPDEV